MRVDHPFIIAGAVLILAPVIVVMWCAIFLMRGMIALIEDSTKGAR